MATQRRRCDDKPFAKAVKEWLWPLALALVAGATAWGAMDMRVEALTHRNDELREWLKTIQVKVNDMREQCTHNTATIEAIIRGGSM